MKNHIHVTNVLCHSLTLPVYRNTWRFPCNQCPNIFSKNANLKYHLRINSVKKIISLWLMFKVLLSKCKFEESLESMFRQNIIFIIMWSMCYCFFLKVLVLRNIWNVQSNEKSYPCDQCLMSFSHHTLLKKHLKIFL